MLSVQCKICMLFLKQLVVQLRDFILIYKLNIKSTFQNDRCHAEQGKDAASTSAASAISSRSAKTSGSSSKYVFFDQADRSLPATIAP
jgi:hypothetical protein